MLVQVLIDNPHSWAFSYAQTLQKEISERAITCRLVHKVNEVERGDILVLLSCEQLFKNLHLNKYNLVAHASDLPNGRGWSPLTWQILEGKNDIRISLFEAQERVDSGVIYEQETVIFQGHELIDEMRDKLGIAINGLIIRFIEKYPDDITSINQEGDPSYYRRRKPEDSQLDTAKSLVDQFNLLRVCDNQRYPAFFVYEGYKYVIKIEKENVTG